MERPKTIKEATNLVGLKFVILETPMNSHGYDFNFTIAMNHLVGVELTCREVWGNGESLIVSDPKGSYWGVDVSWIEPYEVKTIEDVEDLLHHWE